MKNLEENLRNVELIPFDENNPNNQTSVSKRLYEEGIVFYLTLGVIGTCAAIIYNSAIRNMF
ncbi:hypothetical protein J4218_01125 [Candidatus Pacearchaeota archaeon]|nr:hypothetical protein [Candidatus Pacearchaeota archaeon]